MKKWKALKVLGWILSIAFGIDLVYILYGCASARYSSGEIAWHFILSIVMITVGGVLINKANKKIKEKELKDVRISR